MSEKLSRALGPGHIRYHAVEPDAYRAAGFPGAHETGNMFQVYRDFEKEMLTTGVPELARKLYPGLHTFDQ